MLKKYTQFIALLTAFTVFCGLSASAFANTALTAAETPVALTGDADTNDSSDEVTTDPADASENDSVDVSVCISYYKSEQDNNNYEMIFTSLSDITDFASFSCTVQLKGGEINSYDILADYTKKSVSTSSSDSDSEITIKFDRNSAGISKAGQLFSLEITTSSVPSEENISIKDFTLKISEEKSIAVNPTLSFKEGDILPKLTEEETDVYEVLTDVLKKFSDTSKLSYYITDSDGKQVLAPLSDYLDSIKNAAESYKSLDNTDNIDKVLEFYGYDASKLDDILLFVNRMYDCRGLTELGFLFKDLTQENILNYRFIFDVYDSKKGLSLTGLEETTALDELKATLTDYNSKKTVLDSVLNASDIDYEELVYSCDKQLSVIQSLSELMYYEDCLNALKKCIDTTYNTVNDKYTGKTETKQYYLTCLDGYKAKIELIENSIDDIPTMTVGIVVYQTSYNVKFERKKKLSDSIKSSVLIEVTDTDGNKIDSASADFASDSLSCSVSMYAERNKYPDSDYIIINGYYIVENAKILIDTQKVACSPTSVANRPAGVGNSTSSSTGKTDTSDSTSSTGGTLFPSNTSSDKSDVDTDKDENKSPFSDISGYSWAKVAIEGLYYAGIINGMEDGVFNPKGEVTREQFSKMVVQLFGISVSASDTIFVDVNPDAWYAPYVNAAFKAGYIQGQSNEYFGIGESIMRQDMATILYRAVGSRGEKAELTFSDKANIAAYAEDAIAELVGLGIISGYEDGSFLPRGTATRAEAAKMIWGVYQLINE